MAKTTYTGANVTPTTDTFSEWVDLTNRMAYDVSTVVITTADVAQPNGTNHAETTGNGHVNGYFSSNYLIANTQLRGGTTSASANLIISSATHPSANLTLDLGTTTKAWGNVYANNLRAFGDVEANYTSDRKIKTNIRSIDGTWEIIEKINGYLFEWNTDDHRSGQTDLGVIAQEVQEVLPFLVDERDDGTLAVKYQSLIPLLVDAVKKLKRDVEELREIVDGRTQG
tara:strand:- start:809 stop:1489 length:681 start_codon:yes stop_codon:yes gene_type:complete